MKPIGRHLFPITDANFYLYSQAAYLNFSYVLIPSDGYGIFTTRYFLSDSIGPKSTNR